MELVELKDQAEGPTVEKLEKANELLRNQIEQLNKEKELIINRYRNFASLIEQAVITQKF